jgi:DNA-binding response OmpR family regulator
VVAGDHDVMRVLVVDDERRLAPSIAEWLRDGTHAVDVAHDGAAALERVAVNDYDVVVLNRDLPVVHGDEVCREVTDTSPGTRNLMLTAAAQVADRVDGLSLGAEDYLTKPFAFAELVARVLGYRDTTTTLLRVRLTLVYGGLFLVAGLVLLGVTYALFVQRLKTPTPTVGNRRAWDDAVTWLGPAPAGRR